MQFLLLVYTDPDALAALPDSTRDALMRDCLTHADQLQAAGTLLAYQQLEPPAEARSVRRTRDRTTITDGPFAETKEVLAGFNLIEAASREDAVRMAETFPWSRYGCVEVRPVRDIDAVRRRVAGG